MDTLPVHFFRRRCDPIAGLMLTAVSGLLQLSCCECRDLTGVELQSSRHSIVQAAPAMPRAAPR